MQKAIQEDMNRLSLPCVVMRVLVGMSWLISSSSAWGNTLGSYCFNSMRSDDIVEQLIFLRGSRAAVDVPTILFYITRKHSHDHVMAVSQRSCPCDSSVPPNEMLKAKLPPTASPSSSYSISAYQLYEDAVACVFQNLGNILATS